MERLRSFLNFTKGKSNGFLDKVYLFARRIRQIQQSWKKVKLVDSRIHVLCTSRSEYVTATIRCLNSFWEFNPQYRACVWLDAQFWEKRSTLFSRLDRMNQVEFRKIPDPNREWQWNKLLIIVDFLGPQDFFSDADIIWNGQLRNFEAPAFFLREFDLASRAASRHLISFLNLREKQDTLMYNVSFVKLSIFSKNPEFSRISKEYYQIIRSSKVDFVIGEGDLPALHRMSEQIAISLAIQNLGTKIEVLKDFDSVMDGRIAESYYLGSSSGWQ